MDADRGCAFSSRLERMSPSLWIRAGVVKDDKRMRVKSGQVYINGERVEVDGQTVAYVKPSMPLIRHWRWLVPLHLTAFGIGVTIGALLW